MFPSADQRIPRVDASAHQPPTRVCVRLKQVVPDLVRHRSTEHQAEALILHRRRFCQKLPPAFVDDSSRANR